MPGSGSSFEKYQAYIASQGKPSKKPGDDAGPGEPAVTISRETGAGAVTFAAQLAEYLNGRADDKSVPWTVFEKNLIRQVLADHGLPGNLEKYMREDSPRTVTDAVGDMLGMHPPNFELVKHTAETIQRLAKMGRCIIVGRGANVVTRAMPNVLHLRLIGSLEQRVTRCADYYELDESDAEQLIRKQDRARRRYLLAYYDVDIEDATNYHFVINVDRFPGDALVSLIGTIVSDWTR